MNTTAEAVSPLSLVRQNYAVRFTTPAFLGDADQNGYWRTPPFKALLREWWRIAAAKDYGYDHRRLREAEGRLFGNAWLNDEFQRSKIMLRLDRWESGKLNQWPVPDPTVTHREVTNHAGNPRPVGSHLYLGYGPLVFRQGNTALKANAAIQADEINTLRIACPKAAADLIQRTLQLMDWFGALGGRSRNGWGSLELTGEGGAAEAFQSNHRWLQAIARPLNDCLQLDWPHALGSDQQGLLIWKTKNGFNHWRDAMKELAHVKITFRTALKFTSPNGQPDHRHVLAYPVTNHRVNAWGNQARLANQLRFKVIRTGHHLTGLVYHLPCATPDVLLRLLRNGKDSFRQQQLPVWQAVHAQLDTLMNRWT